MALLQSCPALSEKYKARVTPFRFFIHKTVDPQPSPDTAVHFFVLIFPMNTATSHWASICSSR